MAPPTAAATVFKQAVSFLVVVLRVTDEYPLRVRPPLTPPPVPGLLDTRITVDAQYFARGNSDADFSGVHFCAPPVDPLGNERKDAPAETWLARCAETWYAQRLDDYDVVVFTHDDTVVDIAGLDMRFRYLIGHVTDRGGKPQEQHVSVDSLPLQAWGDFHRNEFAVSAVLLKAAGYAGLQTSGYVRDWGGTYTVAPRLSDLPGHTPRSAELAELFKYGITVYPERAISLTTLPPCVHPVAVVITHGSELEMRQADALRLKLLRTLTCDHTVIMVDDGGLVQSSTTDLRLHKRSADMLPALARLEGIRLSDAVAQMKGGGDHTEAVKFDAIAFFDAARLDFDDEDDQNVGWVTRIANTLFETGHEDVVGVHPVLSGASATGYPFLRTESRAFTAHFRNSLDASDCCRAVWIFGEAVAPFFRTSWLNAIGRMDPLMPRVGQELELSYWARKQNKKLLVSESVVVTRRGGAAGGIRGQSETKTRDNAGAAAGVSRPPSGTTVDDATVDIDEADAEMQAQVCAVFSSTFGAGGRRNWPDVVLFGGGAEDTVDRLARSNGKQVLYKPSGERLKRLMAPHQRPSIDDVKRRWQRICPDSGGGGELGPGDDTDDVVSQQRLAAASSWLMTPVGLAAAAVAFAVLCACWCARSKVKRRICGKKRYGRSARAE